MLSDYERRQLTSIEGQLRSDDPDLARRLSRWPPSMTPRWATAATYTVISLSGIGLLIGLLSLHGGLLIGCGLPMLAALAWLSRRARRSRLDGGAGPDAHEEEPGEPTGHR